MKSSEYLSRDILEEGHLKSFWPFHVIQIILGSCRVDARHRFVTSPTIAQKIYTIACLLACLAFYVSVIRTYFTTYVPYPNLYYLSLITLFIHYGTYACNIIHARFISNESNVKFYVRMQEIDRKLKIDKKNYFSEMLFTANLVTVSVTLLITLLLYATAITNDLVVIVSCAGPLYGQLTCTLEWLNCTNLLIYFYIRLRYINAIMVNYLEDSGATKVKILKSYTFPTMEVLRYLASDTHNFELADTDAYIKDIFEEFFRFQLLYRFQIFLFCFKFVTTTLLFFQFGLQALQYNVLRWFECIIVLTITIVDLIIIASICARCESFFREIKTTKYLCIKILSLVYSGPIRKKANKMLKMVNEKPPQFSVYDMWQMKATTMLTMINLVTTLMVTLLQFALL